MNAAARNESSRGLAVLRRLAARRAPAERCELCGAPVAEAHAHLVDPRERRLLCACPACAILFDDAGVTRYRCVPRDSRALPELAVSAAAWSALGIPIGLAFLFRSSAAGSMLAIYPSPAGPTEAPVEEEAWREIAALDPALAALRPDVEALLVNRIRGARDYFVAPIDRCYRLAGLIRRYWSGFSGGDEIRRRIAGFFEEMKEDARRA